MNRLIRLRCAALLGLSLVSPFMASAHEGERQLFAVVDDAGRRRFTSDPAAAREAVTPPEADELAPAKDDSEAVATSLRQYVAGQPQAGWAAEKLGFHLTVSPELLAAEAGNKDQARASAERVELLLAYEQILDPAQQSYARQGLARLVFPLLRSIYPNAFLSVTIHDGLHTVSRADWERDQPEPTSRVQ